MAVLVSDPSVLIDLERGGLLETVFLCELSLVVPDVLYDDELRDYNGPYLIAIGLTVTELNADEMQLAQEILNARPGLSSPDAFALACAHRPGHVLLSGDGPLRAEAVKRKIMCSGLLWLLDEMLASGRVRAGSLHEGLVKISQDPRCRLPKAEVEKRLIAWAKLAAG